MLKNCIIPIDYDNLFNKSCGEIICQSETNFAIICKWCDIKIFEYDEFIEHFRSKHWPETKTQNKKRELIEVICDDYEDNNTSEYIKTEKQTVDQYGEDIMVEEYVFIPEDNVKDEDWREDDANSNSSCDFDDEDLEPISILKKKCKISANQNDKPYKCDQCNRTFSNKSNYNTHKEKHKSNEYKCDKCDKSFHREQHLIQHQLTHNGYPCKDCDKVFEKPDSLRYHKETHITTRDFKCDYLNCTKTFATQRRLNSHKRLHFLEAIFVCEVCGSRQRNKKALTDHIRTHTGEKPFGCDMCDRRFTSKSLLNEHKACHETERKHVCDVCGKSFNRHKALYHHKHLHLDVKKFVCKICGSDFAQAAGLSAHMRKHKQEKMSSDINNAAAANNLLNLIFPF